MFPRDTARPSTFPLDGPATPHIDARIADTHLHLHGMVWLRSVLDSRCDFVLCISRHSSSSFSFLTSSLLIYSYFSVFSCMFTIVFTSHTRLYPTHVTRPTFSPRPELFVAYLSIHTHKSQTRYLALRLLLMLRVLSLFLFLFYAFDCHCSCLCLSARILLFFVHDVIVGYN